MLRDLALADASSLALANISLTELKEVCFLGYLSKGLGSFRVMQGALVEGVSSYLRQHVVVASGMTSPANSVSLRSSYENIAALASGMFEGCVELIDYHIRCF